MQKRQVFFKTFPQRLSFIMKLNVYDTVHINTGEATSELPFLALALYPYITSATKTERAIQGHSVILLTIDSRFGFAGFDI